MISDIIARLLGMIILGLVGWQLGERLAPATPANIHLRWVLIALAAGAVVGAAITPWVTLRPASYLRHKIRQVSPQELLAVIVGLLLGLIVAALLVPVLAMLPKPLSQILPFVGAVIFGYAGILIATLRWHDMLAFLRGRSRDRDAASQDERPVLLDTSVIIDGRIADISQTGFISGPMLVPRFVLTELQHIADSPDALRRNRGRRGLDILSRLKAESLVPVRITDMDAPEARDVDDKLVVLARKLACPILTNDFNLNRVAKVQGVRVLNINDLANAVKAALLPGETITIKIIQEGKEVGQGIGYLDDGTMIVVEEGRPYIGQTIPVLIKKVLQRTEGRLVFAQPENGR
jgi:uncharacterized protein YacL